ncbi:energy transducer TonB [Flavobacterium luteolum]|uniref:energy transducer TonB n=1 Tax=Flavobacterium luteolum TaxID=3003259 RepID=UPI0032C3FB4A
MKKVLFLILICGLQTAFSQNTKQVSKTKASETKNEKPVIINDKNLYFDSHLVVEEAPPANSDNTVYNTAEIDIKPIFPGGFEKFYKFVENNFKYSDEGVDLKGKKIYARFIVEQDGALTDIKILKDAGYNTGTETIRVLKKCPRWSPGEKDGKKVRVLYSLPITLK